MKINTIRLHFFIAIAILLITSNCKEQSKPSSNLSYGVIPDPSAQVFRVELDCSGFLQDSLDLKLPVWTPGYYQVMDYAKNITDFEVTNNAGNNVEWEKINKNTWRIHSNRQDSLLIKYVAKTGRSFVATSFMNNERAFITPAGLFMHIDDMLHHPVTITIHVPNGVIATGLDPFGDTRNQFTAPNFDMLYDCPILLGQLEALPEFQVRNIPHRFIGYQLGDFDRIAFISDLRKIVEAGVEVIDAIPYNQYTFLAIGPGRGGLEHLNSTAFAFNGAGLNNRSGKLRLYTFLAHEYFHHFNVKRIRPIELGPFDYDGENRTRMLWVSEGFTVYYDLLLVRRAGLMTVDELLDEIRSRLRAYETKPGRLFQSATEASYNTWSEGPFGTSGSEINKTISVYDKGAILGTLLDLNIRHVTQNKNSLDDVMRTLYQEYYLEKERGFTEEEFRSVCERIAGESLQEVFEYASTVKPIDYKKYFGYAGLDIDSEPQKVPGGWLGLRTRRRADSLFITEVEYESPAWNAGLRRGMTILDLSVENNDNIRIRPMLEGRKPGERVLLKVVNQGTIGDFSFKLGEKVEPPYTIRVMDKRNDLQNLILKAWGSLMEMEVSVPGSGSEL